MEDQKIKDLFNEYILKTDLNNTEFLLKLSMFLNTKNPFIKASGNNELNNFFKEGWKRFISKYNYCYKEFSLLNKQDKFQFFIISAFSCKPFLKDFIKTYFKENMDSFEHIFTKNDPLSPFYNYNTYNRDKFKKTWFKLVKHGFPNSTTTLLGRFP